MPWKECNVEDERLRFVARLLDGEKMAGLCREFGISRKTGYKIFNRYRDTGLEGLAAASHARTCGCSTSRVPRYGQEPPLDKAIVDGSVGPAAARIGPDWTDQLRGLMP